MTTTPPDSIGRYQAAHDRHDTDAALAEFADDARVADDGHEYRGIDEIRRWIDTAAVEFTFTRTLLSAEEDGPGSWLVRNHLEGNFPGGEVDLAYRFVLAADGRIADLDIAP